jgi:hypothetical protein
LRTFSASFYQKKIKTKLVKNNFRIQSGANPTIASYNASVVKIYSAVNSMARFSTKKNIFSPI